MITVYFKNGNAAEYTRALFADLTNDKAVRDIVDSGTGEILWTQGDKPLTAAPLPTPAELAAMFRASIRI